MYSLTQLSVECYARCYGNTHVSLDSVLMCIYTVLKQHMLFLSSSDVVQCSFEKVRNDLNVDIVSRWLRCMNVSLWKTCHLNKQRVRRTDLFEVRGMITEFI